MYCSDSALDVDLLKEDYLEYESILRVICAVLGIANLHLRWNAASSTSQH
jgi:hypothetical protein